MTLIKVPTVRVERYWVDSTQALGVCSVLVDGCPVFSALSLERGWRDNKRSESCVPLGCYRLVFEYSDKFKRKLWELKGVWNRSECKFHPANYWFDLEGCIALGLTARDINNDGYLDLTDSGMMMRRFHSILLGYDLACLEIVERN